MPLCVTTFVFGGEYQEFIPLFVYSLLRACPEYYPLVFVQQTLVPVVRQRLELLRGLGRFQVKDNYLTGLGWKGQRGKALRWLVYDREFSDFEAVYVGDIDMLMMPETPKLHEQHNVHCRVIGLPYSNVLRPTVIKKVRKDPVSLIRRVRRAGWKNALRSLACAQVEVNRLTGLHYIRTEEYFRAVLPKMLEFMALLGGGAGESLLDRPQYLDGFSNECLLFDLVQESGLGLPPVAEDMAEPVDLEYKRFNSPDFRPHHGIHLGIFRTPSLDAVKASILRLPCYREYYRHYQNMKADPLFQKMLGLSSESTRTLLARMETACAAVAASEDGA